MPFALSKRSVSTDVTYNPVMSAIAPDSIAALFAAGEGRFEWKAGRLVTMEPVSDEHSDEAYFLTSAIGYYAEETGAGRIKPDGFAQRLDEDTVRVPDVAFFRKDNLGKIKPTHSEGGADLVIEIVSRDSRLRDKGEKFYLTSGQASRSTGSSTLSGDGRSSSACETARTSPSCPTRKESSTRRPCPASSCGWRGFGIVLGCAMCTVNWGFYRAWALLLTFPGPPRRDRKAGHCSPRPPTARFGSRSRCTILGMSVRHDLERKEEVGVAILGMPRELGAEAIRSDEDSKLRAEIALDLGDVDELLDHVCLAG